MNLTSVARALLTVLAVLSATACSPRKFSVPTSSMAPTIPPGSEVIGDMSTDSSRAPQRWDVALFDPPPFAGQGQIWVMRVIGLPGEQVSFGPSGSLIINGQPLKPPTELSGIHWQRRTTEPNPVPIPHPHTIPPDSYYVLGDNPPRANDSRFWGAVPRENILGKVIAK